MSEYSCFGPVSQVGGASPVLQANCPWRRTSDDSSGDRPHSGAAWPDHGGVPNNVGVLLRGGPALCASYLYASRHGANRLYESASGRHASIGRHGQATALVAC